MEHKDCGHHDDGRRKFLRFVVIPIAVIVFLAALAVFLVWLILRPSRPSYVLQDATVYGFNVTTSPPSFLSSYIGLTFLSHNPNKRIGIYYDRVDVYAVYRSQQITLRTSIHPFYQSHKETNVWSPFVTGDTVPIAPYNGVALISDQSSGVVRLVVKIDGRIRWKVGSFISGGYHLHISCPAILSFGSKSTGIVVDKGVKYQLVQSCFVSV